VNKVFAGGILYWSVNASHVALVTYGDTVTVKYTQHSSALKDAIYRNSSGVIQTAVAAYYLPVASIMI